MGNKLQKFKIILLGTSLAFSTQIGAKSKKKASGFNAYGKLNIMGFVQGQDLSVEDSGSRLGLKAFQDIPELNLKAYAKGEWSFNAVDNSSELSIGESNNFVSSSEVGQTFRRRLGFVGLKNSIYGDFRFGKQWSVYSDVSHFTDNFNLYGGSASGTYNLRTDGGQSGTGRVSKGITYRNNFCGFNYGLQVKLIQNKKLTVAGSETELIAKDGFGASLKRKFFNDILEFGLAYNQIEMEGDKGSVNGYSGGNSWSAVAGLKLRIQDFLTAITVNQSKDHELDDNKEIFDGQGFEVYMSYELLENLKMNWGYNNLKPRESEYTNKYEVKHYILGFSHILHPKLKYFVEGRVNDSQSYLGEKEDNNSLGFGLSYKLN